MVCKGTEHWFLISRFVHSGSMKEVNRGPCKVARKQTTASLRTFKRLPFAFQNRKSRL